MNEVESKAAAQQRLIEAMRCFAHVRARMRRGRTLIEELRALTHNDANVGDGAASREMSIMFGGPPEIIGAHLLPAVIFSKAIF